MADLVKWGVVGGPLRPINESRISRGITDFRSKISIFSNLPKIMWNRSGNPLEVFLGGFWYIVLLYRDRKLSFYMENVLERDFEGRFSRSLGGFT